MKKLLILMALMLVYFVPVHSYAQESNVVNLSHGAYFSTTTLHNLALRFAEKYPDLVRYELIGYSYDKRPIYAIVLTDDANNWDENFYTNKMHVLVHAGLHGKETYNPVFVIKMIEDYINDYYDDDTLDFVNMRELLKTNAIHFIPLSNPDGFEVSKFGIDSVRNPIFKTYFKDNVSSNTSGLKANIRGVDLNRNFENLTLDKSTMTWVNDVGKKERYAIIKKAPGLAFFPGYKQGSERETQLLQYYYLKYDFRAYLSYHSAGHVIYGRTGRFGAEVQAVLQRYADVAANVTGFKDASFSAEISSWGYEERFVNANTNKALITIETLKRILPPNATHQYKEEYENSRLNEIPIAFVKTANELGYFDHKLYKAGRYVRDFADLDYAIANAFRIGGDVASYEGKPKLYFDDIEMEDSTDSAETTETENTEETPADTNDSLKP